MINLVVSTLKKNPDDSVCIHHGNVGDICGFHILKHYAPHITINPISYQTPRQDTGLVLVGSTLAVFFRLVKSGTAIGTGAIGSSPLKFQGDYQFLGVRGYKTAQLLGGNVPVVGDLGLLLPKVFPMTIPDEQKDCGFIIHSVDREQFFSQYPQFRPYLINNYNNPRDFVSELSQYKRVVSSSLHGLIFAHAYGIPCVGIEVTDKVMGGNFKYQDYYSSLDYDYAGRKPIAGTDYLMDEWVEMVGQMWNPTHERIRSLQQYQETVLQNYLTTQS